jgi:hypothetical protein
MEIVEDQRGIADRRQRVDQFRQEHLHDSRLSEHRRRRGHFERRTDTAKGREHVRPQHDGVVVGLVETHPSDRLRRFLELAPLAQEGGLAAAGRGGDDRQLDTGSRAKPLDETVARDRLLPPRGRVQLRHQ